MAAKALTDEEIRTQIQDDFVNGIEPKESVQGIVDKGESELRVWVIGQECFGDEGWMLEAVTRRTEKMKIDV